MKNLLDALTNYEANTQSKSQRDVVRQFRDFIAVGTVCANRTFLPGHLTGSALVATQDLSCVLLTLHRKLNRWLQLGGHADGSTDLLSVAMREAREESGLTELNFAFPEIFDLDIHWIPEGKDPGHYHYDVRYLLTTPTPEKIMISDESHELRWFTLHEAYDFTYEAGMHRLFDKVREPPRPRIVKPYPPS